MTTQQTLSTNKLLLLLVFLAAAIMASVFVYRATHPTPVKETLASDVGLLFPTPRELKDFQLVQANGDPLTLSNFRGHWSLVFFGFTHCANVCPTTLDLLQHVYQPLHDKYSNLQVVFISLDPERDTKQVLNNYMNTYHTDFVGASGKIEELRKLQSQMGIYAQKNMGANGKDYSIQHTSSIMVVNPQGQWVGLLKFGLKQDQMTTALNQILSSVS